MTILKISVLGSLQVSAGKVIHNKFESNKVRALFTYLVVEKNRPHSREFLAEMFWPESPAQTSLANLRYALADLRKVIGDEEANPPYLIVSRESLQFNVSSNHELDAVVFIELINSDNIEKLKQGLALYQGDFLAGFPSIESGPFEEWTLLKREQFKRQAVEALRLITDHHEQRGEYQQALPFARRQVELEPWLEEAHQQLMRLLAMDGQRSAALAQYETCQRTLASELDVEPSRETTELYESIRDGKLEKVHPLLKREPPAPGDPPFKGLQHFDETDAGLFFGREALVSHLVEQIHSREKTKGARFLAIIGASGSGKSSLVRAGLIPTLKRGDKLWQAHVITPTEHPLLSLRGVSEASDEAIHESQGRLLRRFAARNDELLFVDQFEELFTLCQNKSERKSFVNKLLHTAQEVSVVIALRADFYAACAPYENLRKVLSQNQEYIGPMNAGELRRAIEEPALANGWLFEPGLTDLLLRDIGADGERSPEPGALPLLSHALLETWHRRSGRMLTLAGYAEAGKISQAITKTAESVFAQFSAEEQTIARNIFLRLTELGEGTQETRRRVQLSEIIPPPELGKATETVLKMLSDARLIITTEATAEVAHEALIREWNRLHEWLTENREGLRLHRHITESAREWEVHGRDAELAYRGTRLAQALEWAETHADDLNLLEREFLETSKALAEREAAEREMQRQNELDAARKLAESERQRAEGQTRTSKQLRQRAVYLSGIVLVAIALAVMAFFQRNSANRQTHLAAARELALASINNLDVDSELSILLALQAVEESELANVPIPYEVQDALHRAIQASRIQYTVTAHSDVLSVAFSPDGKLLATAGGDNTAKLWDAASGKERTTLRGHTQLIEDIAFSPDGKLLATVSDDKTARIWDVEGGKEIRTLAGHSDIIWNVSFSGDGELLATGGDQEAKVWNVDTGGLVLNLEGQRGPVAFNPALNQLATASLDGRTIIWNSETWEEERSLPYDPNTLVFSPDGKRLATAMTELKIWDVTSGEEIISATGFAALVRGIEFSPDGKRLGTAGQDGSVIVWDTETGSKLFGLAGHAGAVNDVDFSPECVAPPNSAFEWCGTRLATAGRDGTARVWDVSPGGSRELVTLPGFTGSFFEDTRLFTNSLDLFNAPNEIVVQTWDISPDGNYKRIFHAVMGHAAPIVGGNTSPNGKYNVTVDLDNTVKAWDTQTIGELSSFTANHAAMVAVIAISSSGTRIATYSEDGSTKVWDAATGKELLALTHASPVTALAFSPDGEKIAAGDTEGTIKVWDTTSGREALTLAGHQVLIYTVSVSADGKRVATGGMDQTARIWDSATGKNLLMLNGHTASVLAVAFSPDGSLLATGGHDSTARIWDLANGKELLTLTGIDGWVDTVGFSPNGKFLLAGSFQDMTVHVYLLDIIDVVALAQLRLTRSFTLEECQKYLHQSICP